MHAIFGPICNSENMWDLFAIQDRHASRQAIGIRTNMQLAQIIGLNCKSKANRQACNDLNIFRLNMQLEQTIVLYCNAIWFKMQLKWHSNA